MVGLLGGWHQNRGNDGSSRTRGILITTTKGHDLIGDPRRTALTIVSCVFPISDLPSICLDNPILGANNYVIHRLISSFSIG